MLKVFHLQNERVKAGFLLLFFLISLFPLSFIPIEGHNVSIHFPGVLIEYNVSLNFSTYFGGINDDWGISIASFSDGSCYITGRTNSANFPTMNAYNSTYGGDWDAFVAKFSTNGSLIWSTYLGGNAIEYSSAIAVFNDGSCYVTGFTNSSDFPTKNAYNNTYSGGYNDAFVAKFSTNGSLLWSTYLGGSNGDSGLGIAVACEGNCYVTGGTNSPDFPTRNAYDNGFNGGTNDVFVAKFSTDGSLLWSTYLGGKSEDVGYSIAIVSDDSCYVTGSTYSTNFPTLNAYNNTFGGYVDVFLTKFSTIGSFLWSTYLGGSDGDSGKCITVLSDGNCFVTGETRSNNFPILNASDSTFNGGTIDAFVTKFSFNGSLLWSTFLGGNDYDFGRGIDVTSDGSCYVTGCSYSPNFPTLEAYDSNFNGGSDAFVTKYDTTGSLLWSTFLGGDNVDMSYDIAIVNDSNCIVIGITYSPDFPIVNAYDNEFNSGWCSDVFITKFNELILSSTTTIQISAYGFLVFVIIMPIIIHLIRKRRK